MTAKMIRIEIAPIYTSTWTTAKKLDSSKANITATPRRVNTSHKAACMILRALTTATAEPKMTTAVIRKINFIAVMLHPPRMSLVPTCGGRASGRG